MVLLLCAVACSCATPSYMHVYKSAKGLDFSEGKWLVPMIDARLSLHAREGMSRELLKGLRGMGGDSIYSLNDVKLRYITPERFKFELSDQVLETLRKTTDFRYVVTSTARKLRNEVGNIVSPEYPVSYQKSESEVCIAVYEVRTGARIYYQQVIASVSLDAGDEKVVFGRSAESLLFNALNKAMKDLKKNSRKIRKIRQGGHSAGLVGE